MKNSRTENSWSRFAPAIASQIIVVNGYRANSKNISLVHGGQGASQKFYTGQRNKGHEHFGTRGPIEDFGYGTCSDHRKPQGCLPALRSAARSIREAGLSLLVTNRGAATAGPHCTQSIIRSREDDATVGKIDQWEVAQAGSEFPNGLRLVYPIDAFKGTAYPCR